MKCQFAANDILILGFHVQDGLIYPDESKISAVVNYPAPKNKTQPKAFLGLTAFLRGHISHYATIAYLLFELLKRNKPDKLVWGERELSAFDQMKSCLASRPAIQAPDMSKPWIIMADS